MKSLLIALALAGFGLAQTKPEAPKDAKPPQITTEQRARFWRANAEYVSAIAQQQQAKARLESVQAELKAACGDLELSMSPKDGEPTCLAKPPEPTKPLAKDKN